MKMDGKKIAQQIIAALNQKPTPKKFLAVFLIGDDSASVSFIKQKENIGKELGIDFRLYKYPEGIKNDELREKVRKTTQHKTCGGALVQLPLPSHLNKHYILNVVPREKDVDVLGERALGAFYAGRNPVLPPSVGTVEKILKATSYQLKAKKVAVIGAGLLVGKPISMWLEDKAGELAVFTNKTESLSDKLKDYDLVISGAGKAGLIKPEYLKKGAGVIDFGCDMAYGEVRGDFDASDLKANRPHRLSSASAGAVSSQLKAGFYTPTPGGTGPILVAQLFENFYILNERR